MLQKCANQFIFQPDLHRRANASRAKFPTKY